MLSSVSALSAQNIGAGKHNRASLTLRYAILITASFGIVMAVLIQFTAGYAVGLFTNNSDVIVLGDEYLRSYVGIVLLPVYILALVVISMPMECHLYPLPITCCL